MKFGSIKQPLCQLRKILIGGSDEKHVSISTHAHITPPTHAHTFAYLLFFVLQAKHNIFLYHLVKSVSSAGMCGIPIYK